MTTDLDRIIYSISRGFINQLYLGSMAQTLAMEVQKTMINIHKGIHYFDSLFVLVLLSDPLGHVG